MIDYATIKTLAKQHGLTVNDLCALPTPELPPEKEDTLYNSQRDYANQLTAYKSYRFGLNGKDH